MQDEIIDIEEIIETSEKVEIKEIKGNQDNVSQRDEIVGMEEAKIEDQKSDKIIDIEQMMDEKKKEDELTNTEKEIIKTSERLELINIEEAIIEISEKEEIIDIEEDTIKISEKEEVIEVEKYIVTTCETRNKKITDFFKVNSKKENKPKKEFHPFFLSVEDKKKIIKDKQSKQQAKEKEWISSLSAGKKKHTFFEKEYKSNSIKRAIVNAPVIYFEPPLPSKLYYEEQLKDFYRGNPYFYYNEYKFDSKPEDFLFKMDQEDNLIMCDKIKLPEYEQIIKQYQLHYKELMEHPGLHDISKYNKEMDYNTLYSAKNSWEFLSNKHNHMQLKAWLEKWKLINYNNNSNIDFEDRDYIKQILKEDSDDEYFSKKIVKKTKKNSNTIKLPPIMLVHGKVGTGKTSSVYLCGKESGYQILEINASMKRSGKDLITLIGHISKNHLVKDHQLPNLLILLEDVDILFLSDKNFLNSLIQLATTTKRPFVLTSCDSFKKCIPSHLIYKDLKFEYANEQLLIIYFQLLCFRNGYLLTLNKVKSILNQFNLDFRRILLYLESILKFNLISDNYIEFDIKLLFQGSILNSKPNFEGMQEYIVLDCKPIETSNSHEVDLITLTKNLEIESIQDNINYKLNSNYYEYHLPVPCHFNLCALDWDERNEEESHLCPNLPSNIDNIYSNDVINRDIMIFNNYMAQHIYEQQEIIINEIYSVLLNSMEKHVFKNNKQDCLLFTYYLLNQLIIKQSNNQHRLRSKRQIYLKNFPLLNQIAINQIQQWNNIISIKRIRIKSISKFLF